MHKEKQRKERLEKEKPALWQEGWEGICPVVWGYKEDSARVAEWEFTVE